MAEYYNLLSSLSALLTGPLTQLSDQIDIPIISALLLGLIAAASPCQLSTNVAALAYVGRRLGSPRALWPSALAYLAGKALVYTILGVAAVVLGKSLNQAAIPVIVVLRKMLGPAFVVFGFFMLGVVRLNVNLGGRLAERWRERVGAGRAPDAFVLGIVLSLFFGITIARR
jgi:cytochrome c-type biogenesis protein